MGDPKSRQRRGVQVGGAESLGLARGQGVKLELAALVPQPGVWVDHLAQSRGSRKGRGLPDDAFDVRDHFGRMAGRPHPLKPAHAAQAVIAEAKKEKEQEK